MTTGRPVDTAASCNSTTRPFAPERISVTAAARQAAARAGNPIVEPPLQYLRRCPAIACLGCTWRRDKLDAGSRAARRGLAHVPVSRIIDANAALGPPVRTLVPYVAEGGRHPAGSVTIHDDT